MPVVDFNVAGALLERVSGQPLGTLFDEWIAKSVGMEDYRPDDVSAVLEPGVSKWPALTIRMSARDLARFGLLWLNRGNWDGRQLVPAEWIERAEVAASSTGAAGQGYGMMWWTYEAGSVDAQRYPQASRARILLARGTGGQTIAVVPEANIVIVHRGDTDNSRMVSGRDVWTLIDRILGARRVRDTNRSPALAAMRVEPFASQLPPFVWPKPVALEASAIRPLLGEYQLRPGMVARVFLHDGRLYASVPGRGEAELFALSPTEFFVRVDPSARIRFEDGAVRVTIDGRELVAMKK